MAPLALNRVASRVSAPAASPRAGVVRAPRTVVFAQEPRFTLDNSKQSAEGYVEKDTAGQSNMYPSVMKPFEAGSSADTVQQDSFNTSLAVGTSVVALGAIGLGLVALLKTGGAPAPVVEEAGYLSLTAYSSKFSEQLAPAKPVVVAPVVEAPVVEAVPVVEAPVLEAVAVVEAPVVEAVAVVEAPVLEAVAVVEAAAVPVLEEEVAAPVVAVSVDAAE